MATETFVFGAAFGAQATAGTKDPTIDALATSLVNSDGIVQGDAGSGIGESGISLKLNRKVRENSVISGSFTRPASSFLGIEVATLTIAFQLKGNGLAQDASPVDAHYEPVPGIDAILEACGLDGAAWGSGVGWAYSTLAPQIITAKIWGAFGSLVIYDIVGNLSLDFTPGDVCIATAKLSGITTAADRDGAEAFPTFDYTNEAGVGDQSVSSPVIESVGHNFGISAAARGFTDAVLTVDNQTEVVKDSNAVGGEVTRATGREVDLAMTLLGDDGDSDFELSNLEATVAPTDQLDFTVGGTVATGEAQTGFQIIGTNPEIREWTPEKIGADAGAQMSMALVDNAANGELELIFL